MQISICIFQAFLQTPWFCFFLLLHVDLTGRKQQHEPSFKDDMKLILTLCFTDMLSGVNITLKCSVQTRAPINLPPRPRAVRVIQGSSRGQNYSSLWPWPKWPINETGPHLIPQNDSCWFRSLWYLVKPLQGVDKNSKTWSDSSSKNICHFFKSPPPSEIAQ